MSDGFAGSGVRPQQPCWLFESKNSRWINIDIKVDNIGGCIKILASCQDIVLRDLVNTILRYCIGGGIANLVLEYGRAAQLIEF